MAVNSSIYPYDPNGDNPDCKIVSERHNVQPPSNITDASLFFLKAAPAYASSIVIRTGLASNAPVLVEGQDYILSHKFLFKSWELTKPIYGSITLLNRDYTGDLYIDYQTLGGPFVLDDVTLVENLTKSIYRTRFVYWEQVAGIIPGLPPYDHSMSGTDTIGWGEVVDSILQLAAAIIDVSGGGGTGGASLNQHLLSTTAHQLRNVGGSNLFNYPLAALADFDGTGAANKYTNPSVIVSWVKNYINGLGLNNAATNIDNIQTAINTINLTIQSLQSNAASQDTLINDLTNLVDTLSDDVDALEQNVATATAQIPSMVDDINDLKNQVGAVGATDLTTRVDNLETTVASTLTDITNIQTELQDHETRLTDLEAGLASPDLGDIPVRLSAAESTIITINSDLTNVKSRLKTLELGFDKALTNVLLTESTTIIVEPDVVVSFVAVATVGKKLLVELLEVGETPLLVGQVSDEVLNHATKLTAVTGTAGVVDGAGWELVTGQFYGGVEAASGDTSSGKLEATYTNSTTENAKLMFTIYRVDTVSDINDVPSPGAVLLTVTYP